MKYANLGKRSSKHTVLYFNTNIELTWIIVAMT